MCHVELVGIKERYKRRMPLLPFECGALRAVWALSDRGARLLPVSLIGAAGAAQPDYFCHPSR